MNNSNTLNPIAGWFASRGYTPFDFQRDVWEAYLNGESGLIYASTGAGKTYAAWLGALAEWIDANPDRDKWRKKSGKRDVSPLLHVLWITPMRALAADTAMSLQTPLDDLGLPWTLETRTGDTSSSVRSRQRKRLPTALVTTPESLSLLLARDNAHELFAHLKLVVVDEWHELLASKRGVQVELGLARLRRWHPNLRTWGLSATMGNLDVAMRSLLGVANPDTGEVPQGRLVRGDVPKNVIIDAIIPESMERFPWAGHLGLKLLPRVIKIIDAHSSTLVFTNTRSQTEQWYQSLIDARPDYAGVVALHHSALDKGTREWVENGLRAGTLKAVVCTSSLDLGVDFPDVERVVQIGSPKGVARLLQRAGRSGHQPGTESRVTVVPTHAFELVEVAAVREAAQAGNIEARPPIENALDVLVQHMVTVALGGGFMPDELYEEVRTAYSYRSLTRMEWEWALGFVTHGGDALRAYEQYQKVVPDEQGSYTVPDKRIAQTHRMSIGTITSDPMIKVKYLNGAEVGLVNETFVSRLTKGDTFVLAGKLLEFVNMRELTVYVRKAKKKTGTIPRWTGSGLPLSDELTTAIRAKLDAARNGVFASDELRALIPILKLQAQWSAIPSAGKLLVERTKTRDGHHLFFYPFAGKFVHEGLAALFAYRLSQYTPITFTLVANDYGFELLSPDEPPLETSLTDGLLSTDALADDITASMNASEMARRQFRQVARVSGLVIERFPGGKKSAKQLQASSGLLYDVLAKYDEGNLLLAQAEREVLERQLEQTRLYAALQAAQRGGIELCDTRRPTPLAFPLLVSRLRQTVSSETLEDRIQKMIVRYEKDAGVTG